MRISIALAQIYGVFAQLPVSPVAYVPAESLAAGYRVIAELSRGWAGGPVMPFVQGGPWLLRRQVEYPAGAALYIEGLLSEIAVWQGGRLLFVGYRPWVWVPLIGAGRAEIRLTGSSGGIGGGIYLMARSDTIAWPAEPWPAETLRLCTRPARTLSASEALSTAALRKAKDSCLAVSVLPPARVRQALPKGSCLCKGTPPVADVPLAPMSPVLFVLLLGLIGATSSVLPVLRRIRWRGFFAPTPVNILEAAVGLAVALVVSWAVLGTADFSLWILLWAFVGVESIFLSAQGVLPHWAWQSWEGLWLFGLGARLFAPVTFWVLAGAAWALRAARLTLTAPSFAYLCTAEYFVYLLLLSA